VVPLVVFVVGWTLACAALARLIPGLLVDIVGRAHRAPSPYASNRYRFDAEGNARRLPSVSVVIPARNEENNIAAAIESVVIESDDRLQVVVVDDHSTDGTAAAARRAGAYVRAAADLPEGWTGKCWACHTGAATTEHRVVVFVDADVRLAPGALDAITARVADDTLVSVQPWHDAGRTFEQLSVIPNLVALMGAGSFSVFGRPGRLAFGPILATTRAGYERSGGFEAVRAEPVEDAALARRFSKRVLLTGRHLATFRMHTTSRQFADGWTRVLRAGVRHGSWFGFLAALVWIGALVAGFTSPWLYVANVVGIVALSRTAGRFGPAIAVLYPVALAVFVALCLRSLVSRQVMWKGRPLRSPQRARRSRVVQPPE
jgi:4,4'-diaponeurosporenoate glycosyltransferase